MNFFSAYWNVAVSEHPRPSCVCRNNPLQIVWFYSLLQVQLIWKYSFFPRDQAMNDQFGNLHSTEMDLCILAELFNVAGIFI